MIFVKAYQSKDSPLTLYVAFLIIQAVKSTKAGDSLNAREKYGMALISDESGKYHEVIINYAEYC